MIVVRGPRFGSNVVCEFNDRLPGAPLLAPYQGFPPILLFIIRVRVNSTRRVGPQLPPESCPEPPCIDTFTLAEAMEALRALPDLA